MVWCAIRSRLAGSEISHVISFERAFHREVNGVRKVNKREDQHHEAQKKREKRNTGGARPPRYGTAAAVCERHLSFVQLLLSQKRNFFFEGGKTNEKPETFTKSSGGEEAVRGDVEPGKKKKALVRHVTMAHKYVCVDGLSGV